MSKELSPCPFCGRTDTVAFTTAREMEDCKRADTCQLHDCESVTVVCDFTIGGCGASGRYARTEEEAAEAWNRRARMDGGDKNA